MTMRDEDKNTFGVGLGLTIASIVGMVLLYKVNGGFLANDGATAFLFILAMMLMLGIGATVYAGTLIACDLACRR